MTCWEGHTPRFTKLVTFLLEISQSNPFQTKPAEVTYDIELHDCNDYLSGS